MVDLISREEAVKTALEFLVEFCGAAFDPGLQLRMAERLNAIQPKIGHWIVYHDDRLYRV